MNNLISYLPHPVNEAYHCYRIKVYIREAMERSLNQEPLELKALRKVFQKPGIPQFSRNHRKHLLAEIQV